ncbi:MAG: DUF2061 domain-containing protein [Paracoccaceae bacterium]|nr:DUF2061 domain-containing protein [Paracoccaceae bacterium]
MSDTKLRSISKTISWRLTGTLCTFMVSWLILGDLTTSGTIAIIQLTFDTGVFYIHERIGILLNGANCTDKIKHRICRLAILSKEAKTTI